ncbi:MAG: S8/S53 family peptidase [Lentisphaerae bacterium]|nr:S8/S53 family peptidase [Lentisphaerota bacterium]
MNQPAPPASPGIDPRTAAASAAGAPYNEEMFRQMRVTDTWAKYAGTLTWGKGQCLAILDDGCDLSVPEWKAELPWGKKVIAAWNSIDGNDNPMHVPPGYHGTTVGLPSSQYHAGILGVAYNDFVAHVRCVTVVHLAQDESATMAAALQWVIEQHRRYNITTVNLAPLDDQRHTEPVPTVIDDALLALRKLDIWVSAPCGNHHYTDGISWPACQPYCFGIGGTIPGKHEAHLDRYRGTDLLVCATATSSSNAYAAGCSMILREAIEKARYPWRKDGPTLPDAMLAIFQKTGAPIHDSGTGMDFRELDLFAAVDHVFQNV